MSNTPNDHIKLQRKETIGETVPPQEKVVASAVAENPDEKLEKKITKILNSEKFLQELMQIPEQIGYYDRIRDKIIGLVIEYLILHRGNTTHFYEYIEELKKNLLAFGNPNGHFEFEQKRLKHLIESVKKTLNIEDDSDEAEEKIYKYFRENFIENGYYYHSFNGAFEESIKENGLDPHTRLWDTEELDRINAIGARIGWKLILGWENLNSRGKISMADNTENLYRYAVASPEWFAQFTAEGFHIKPNDPLYDKEAYYRKDYAAAKKNIENFMEEASSRNPNLTLEEKIEILAFFEKHWKLLCGEKSKPMVALIKRSAIERHQRARSSYAECKRRSMASRGEETTLEKELDFIMNSREHDTQTEGQIKPENLGIIELPAYEKIYPKMKLTPTGRRAGGTQGAEWYENKSTGEKYIVKAYAHSGDRQICYDRCATEYIANAIYRSMDIPAPESVMYGGRVASKEIRDLQHFSLYGDPEGAKKTFGKHDDIKNGFVTDAWLANWDVFGLDYDNVSYHPSSQRMCRLDSGGALFYRGMGRYKPSFANEEVTEIQTMRDPQMAREAGIVFKDLVTDEDIKIQVQKLVTIMTDTRIQEIVRSSGISNGKEVIDALIRRKNWLAKNYLDQ